MRDEEQALLLVCYNAGRIPMKGRLDTGHKKGVDKHSCPSVPVVYRVCTPWSALVTANYGWPRLLKAMKLFTEPRITAVKQLLPLR